MVCITESGEKIEMYFIDGEPVIYHPKWGAEPSSLRSLAEQDALTKLPIEERLIIVAFMCASGVYSIRELGEETNVDRQLRYFGFNPNMN